MAKIGYARVSSKQQNLDRQIKALEEKGCKKIFKDISSGKNIERKGLYDFLQLAEKIKYVGEIMPKKERERIQENALRDVKRFSIDVLIENLHELYNCIYRENK